jgi:hypothetical protein
MANSLKDSIRPQSVGGRSSNPPAFRQNTAKGPPQKCDGPFSNFDLNDANEGCGAVPGAGRPEFVPLAGTQSRASEFAVLRPTDLFFGNDLAMELQGVRCSCK